MVAGRALVLPSAAVKVAFVVPRYGTDIRGGAETGARMLAERLASDRGYDVEVLTTCAIDHYTWANDLPTGTSEEDGLVVRRFPMVHTPSRAALKARFRSSQGSVSESERSWTEIDDDGRSSIAS